MTGTRQFRRALWLALVIGSLAYGFIQNPAGMWQFLQYAGAAIGGYFLIQDLFVQPIENQILDLKLEIEALQRQVNRNSR